jgi:hypothetical protein
MRGERCEQVTRQPAAAATVLDDQVIAAEQFTTLRRETRGEQRTGFRGSDEVTAPPENLLAVRVVTELGLVQGHGHELVETDHPLLAREDRLAQARGKQTRPF